MTVLLIVVYFVSFFVAIVTIRIAARKNVIAADDQDVAIIFALFVPPVIAFVLGGIFFADWISDCLT